MAASRRSCFTMTELDFEPSSSHLIGELWAASMSEPPSRPYVFIRQWTRKLTAHFGCEQNPYKSTADPWSTIHNRVQWLVSVYASASTGGADPRCRVRRPKTFEAKTDVRALRPWPPYKRSNPRPGGIISSSTSPPLSSRSTRLIIRRTHIRTLDCQWSDSVPQLVSGPGFVVIYFFFTWRITGFTFGGFQIGMGPTTFSGTYAGPRSRN